MSGRCRAAAQSIVEFALIAPALIILAMGAWDGGSVLREVLVLQEAARNGARAGATAYGGTLPIVVTDAVIASAGDLTSVTSQMVTITNNDAQSITVQVRYPHALITPLLRQLWGGGTVTLSASATFYVPQLTATPLAVTPSTPTATPTATPTLTPSATPTLAPTATPVASTATPIAATATASSTSTATVTPSSTSTPNPTTCGGLPLGQLPALGVNSGYWCTTRITVTSVIWAYWLDDNDANNSINIYANNPFAGQPDPSSLDPGKIAATNLAYNFRYAALGALYGQTSTCVPAGSYAVYFFNRGPSAPASGAGISSYSC